MNGQTFSSPDQTHALVVGIESYPRRKGLDLNGPARDAYRFAKWLRAHGVPATQIILLVSPLPENKILFDERNEDRVRDLGPIDYCVVGPVTHEVIEKALEKLRNTSGLLFLFWTGHGIMTAESNRRPLLANYSDANKYNLNLDSLRDHLRSIQFQYPKNQILTFDICATLFDEKLYRENLPDYKYQAGPGVEGCQQFLMFASD